MPSGRTHDRITLWSLPWLVIPTFWLTRSGELTLLVAGGFLFSGLMFGPDLDIHSIQFKRWGWLRWIWIPYQKAIHHRSRLSHGLLIGTFLRSLYLLVIIFAFAVGGVTIANFIGDMGWNGGDFLQGTLNRWQNYTREAIALFVGLELGAMSHSLADWTTSTYKGFKRQGFKVFLPKAKGRKGRRKSKRKK